MGIRRKRPRRGNERQGNQVLTGWTGLTGWRRGIDGIFKMDCAATVSVAASGAWAITGFFPTAYAGGLTSYAAPRLGVPTPTQRAEA